jgi:tetratricopeptide (TPR) repeat protein
MGKTTLAIQAYLEATRVDARMVDAHYNLGNLYLEMGSYKQAISHYKQVLQLRPNWDKALNGLAQADAALRAAEPQAPPAPKAAPSVRTPEQEEDLNRSINPEIHGDLLTVLHHAAIDSEAHGRQFLQILEHQIEPAIKDLSTRLLGVETSGPDLGQCIQMFESAVDNMRKVQRELESSIERVRSLGEQLLKT